MRLSFQNMARNGRPERIAAALVLFAAVIPLPPRAEHPRAQSPVNTRTEPRLIEVIAGRDSRFKIPGQEKPVITVKASESIRLRVTTPDRRTGSPVETSWISI